MLPPGSSPALMVFGSLHIAASDYRSQLPVAALPHYDVSCDCDEYWLIFVMGLYLVV